MGKEATILKADKERVLREEREWRNGIIKLQSQN